MADRKIIAIVGATGAQGGGLARAILRDGDGRFAVRAITRNPASEKAAALRAKGAEVVQADISDPAGLRNAFRGAYGAFCVTNFWEHMNPETELEQADNMAKAAAEEGLQHVVWSTLEDTRKWVPLDDDRMPTLMGKYKVPHFDAKGEADRFFRDQGTPTTFMMASWYFENMIYFGNGPQRQEDGTLAITLPMSDAPLAGIAAEDIGKCTYGIFKRRDEFIGKTVGLAGDQLPVAEIAEVMTEVLGEEVRYNQISPETFRGFGFPAADDLGNMFQFYYEFGDDVLGARDVARSRALNPELQDFRTWAARHRDQFLALVAE